MTRMGWIVPLSATAVLIGGCCCGGHRHQQQKAPRDARRESSAAHLPQVVRATPRETNKPNFGPPPPGYIRIVGGADPLWTAADMQRRVPRDNAWYTLGPRPITNEYWSGLDNATGRVVGIAAHPTNPDVCYLASASGGVWKTSDGGLNWSPLTDELSTLNHGAIAIDPSNPDTIYVGTGEYTTWSEGDGLFRSTDAGATWTKIADDFHVGTTCSRIVVDPTNPNIIHVAGGDGYARTLDGGAHWTRPLPSQASDVELNPADPTEVLVGVHYDGIYRSNDRGQNFVKLTNGLPSSNLSRILIAPAPSAPGVYYALFIDEGASLRGLYRTSNSGSAWSLKPATPDFPTPQGWYDIFLGVDPTDANTVYGGGVSPIYSDGGVVKSTDGGNSWTEISAGALGGQLHPDHHAIEFGPGGIIWCGNDGGIWKSLNGGQSWINCNATLTLTQNYQIALNPSDPAQLLGGTQDNGTIGREFNVLQWPQVASGDGGFAAWDDTVPFRVYTTYVYLTVYRIEGSGWAEITGPWGSDPRNFISPLAMSATDPSILFGGTNRVWRTTNADTDADWTAISTSAISAGGTLNAVTPAPSNHEIIYTGSTSGTVWQRSTAGTWYDRSAGLPHGEVSDVIVALDDPSRAYISYFSTGGPRVLMTEDFGANWTDVTGTLPFGVALTALEVDWRFDPPYLYAGTGAGVYESADHGATWTKDGADLPNVNIGDLKIDFDAETITAGTYGRGAWRKVLPPPPPLPGDVNCDGAFNFGDIDPFVLALTDAAGYATRYPNCDIILADLNADGSVNFADIDPFVALLTD